MVIEPATIYDWPTIDSMRRTYFARMQRAHYPSREDVVWIVARRDERVLACYSVVDVDGQRWICDLYRADGARGTRAMSWLEKEMKDSARRDGFSHIYFSVDPENDAWQDALSNRGYEAVSISYRGEV